MVRTVVGQRIMSGTNGTGKSAKGRRQWAAGPRKKASPPPSRRRFLAVAKTGPFLLLKNFHLNCCSLLRSRANNPYSQYRTLLRAVPATTVEPLYHVIRGLGLSVAPRKVACGFLRWGALVSFVRPNSAFPIPLFELPLLFDSNIHSCLPDAQRTFAADFQPRAHHIFPGTPALFLNFLTPPPYCTMQ